MQWDQFVQACPGLAEVARKRFIRDQLVLVGNLRSDGWPRISPCEVDIAAGHLFLGMMWRSTKAMDLLRDPRLVVHSVQCNREATEGDLKLMAGRSTFRTCPFEQRFAQRSTPGSDGLQQNPTIICFRSTWSAPAMLPSEMADG